MNNRGIKRILLFKILERTISNRIRFMATIVGLFLCTSYSGKNSRLILQNHLTLSVSSSLLLHIIPHYAVDAIHPNTLPFP